MRRLAPARAAAGEFWRWWTRELEAAWVEFGERLGARWRRRTRVLPTADGFEVEVYRQGALEYRRSLTAADAVASGAPAITAVLEVPDAETLVCSVSLPLAARRDLSSALALQLERLSPVPMAQLYAAVGAPQLSESTLDISATLIRRERLHAWLTALAGLGIRVHRAETRAARPFALAGLGGLELAPRLLAAANATLLAAALGGLVALGVLWQRRLDHEQAWLDRGFAAVGPAASNDVALREQWQRNVRVVSDVGARLRTPDPVRLLATIGERLPPEMWVQSFEFAGERAHLSVYVPARGDVARMLLDAPEVQSVTENARLPLGIGTGAERVDLLLGLRAGAGS